MSDMRRLKQRAKAAFHTNNARHDDYMKCQAAEGAPKNPVKAKYLRAERPLIVEKTLIAMGIDPATHKERG